MKQMNIFWKTWIITVITIFTSMFIFTSTLYIYSNIILMRQKEHTLTLEANYLEQDIANRGLDLEYLNSLYQKGIFASVFLEGTPIYPNNVMVYSENYVSYSGQVGVGVVNETTTEQTIYFDSSSSNQETQDVLLDFDYPIQGENLSVGFTITYQNQEYTVQLFYPFIANEEVFLGSLVGVLPQFVLAALFVSGIVSFLYARYFSHKIQRLNTVIDEMATRVIEPITEYSEGDELKQLENNLFKMYATLSDTVKQLENEIEYSKRLESDRSVFMKGATHELKTPIMIMNSMIEGMIEDVPGYEDREKYLLSCYEELQRMTQLVQEILDAARLEHIKFDGQTNVKQVITNLLDEYQVLFEDKILELTLDIDDDILIFMTTKNIKKVISNLLMNAIKYTPSNQKIKITLKDNIFSIENDTYPMVMKNPNQLETAFVTYQDEKHVEEKGHGLGLYVVDYILKQYGVAYEYHYDEIEKKFLFKIFFE